MIDILRSFFVGGVQGISEFLPISSSGHLVLIPYILKWDYKGLSFDIALHFGTLIAILAYFWKDWMTILGQALGTRSKNRISPLPTPNSSLIYPSNLLWQILIASIPAAILGIILDKYVEKYFHSPLLIASNLIIFGIILWAIDKYFGNNKKIGKITYKQSFLVGLAQSIALVPGVSRSGITMTASRALGLGRKEAARFSFLLATPAMFGAFLLSAKDIASHDLNLIFLFGVISSTFFGFIAIKYLLKYLERGNFSVFVWYRILVAVVVAGIYLAR